MNQFNYFQSITYHLASVTSCTCMDIPALQGNELCQLKEESDFLGSQMCYVKLPSNCTNVQTSTTYLGFLLSSDPCIAKRTLQDMINTNSSTDGKLLKYIYEE